MPERAALISALILESPMCVPCIATTATLLDAEVEMALARIAPVIAIHRELADRCRACGQMRTVVSLACQHTH
jgi:hypothetical protein